MRTENFSNGLVWLSVFMAALSSVKALNAFLDFGFIGIWADVLNYYTKATDPFRVLVSKIPFVVDAPIWLADVLLLYFVLVMAGLRSTVLPYRFDDYYRMHNTRRTYDVKYSRHASETFAEFFERQDEFDLERMVSCVQDDDNFVVKLRDTISRWELIFLQTSKCLTLWPIVSLEPLRKMYNSISTVRQMSKKAVLGEDMIEYETEGGHTLYAKWAINADKLRLDGFMQIISLPVLVTLFLIGATYIK